MGSGGSQSQQQQPGTLSPVTASLIDLFGGNTKINRGQYVPSTTLGGAGGIFSPQTFSALGGLMQNMPATGAEQSVFGQGGFQDIAAQSALQGQNYLQALGQQLASDVSGDAAVKLARQQFSQQTLPAILERAPGFSSSDLQRELTRAGTDLETQIQAQHQQGLMQMAQIAPSYVEALGSNLLNQGANIAAFGQTGRDFLREVSPAGDAFRVLTALQGLTGPGLTTSGLGRSKNVGVL